MRMIASLLAAFAVLFSAPSMAADWYVAETKHFRVYSEDRSSATEEFARDLERLDEVLRIVSGVGTSNDDLPPSAKVIVFRFGETSDMATLAGARNSGIGGFFIPRASGSYAFVPRRQNINREKGTRRVASGMSLTPKGVLFHEYVHYFMYQHRNAPYPAWYREGFAEVFSTVEFEDERFIIGDVPPWRSYSLVEVPIDLEEMFDPPKEPSREYVPRTYAHGWLLASHLNFAPDRRGQFGEYMRLLAAGTPGLDAAKQAFGDLGTLKDELDEYRRGRARVLKVPYMYEDEPDVSVRKLNEAEEARIDMMIRSKVGVDEDMAARQLPEARELVAQYPESAAVLLAATEVEFDNKNYPEAEALAQRVLAIDPKSTDAAIYYARVPLMQSLEDSAKLDLARERFIAANNMEVDHPVPLYNYYLTFILAEEEAPESAKAALESAIQYAPFDNDIRTTLAHMFLLEGEDRIAMAVLQPLANSIEYRGAEKLREAMAKYDDGEKDELIDLVKPKHPAAEPEEEEEEEEEDDED